MGNGITDPIEGRSFDTPGTADPAPATEPVVGEGTGNEQGSTQPPSMQPSGADATGASEGGQTALTAEDLIEAPGDQLQQPPAPVGEDVT